jgi:hypothetical protein
MTVSGLIPRRKRAGAATTLSSLSSAVSAGRPRAYTASRALGYVKLPNSTAASGVSSSVHRIRGSTDDLADPPLVGTRLVDARMADARMADTRLVDCARTGWCATALIEAE